MTQIRQPFDRVLKLIQDKLNEDYDPAILERLKAIGHDAIKRAYDTRDTRIDLGNQIDAYGYGVFYKGKLIGQGYLDKTSDLGHKRFDHVNAKTGKLARGAEPDRKRHKQGRVMAFESVQSFSPQTKGYVLYIANAMWYSSIHESWGLHIITQALMETASRLSKEFKAEIHVDFYNYGY